MSKGMSDLCTLSINGKHRYNDSTNRCLDCGIEKRMGDKPEYCKDDMNNPPGKVYVQKYIRSTNKDGTHDYYWGSQFASTNKDDIEYLPADVVEKRIGKMSLDMTLRQLNAYRVFVSRMVKKEQSATKNIRAVYEQYKFAQFSPNHIGDLLWQAIKADGINAGWINECK